MIASKEVGTSGSTTSPAVDMTDTTFASRARAAELSAARARKLLEDNEQKPEASEPMKFTRPRNKPARAWKPLDLTDLPEAPSDSDEIHSPTDYAYYDGVAVRHVHAGVTDTLHPQNFPQLSKASSSLADASDAKLIAGATDDASTEWDSDVAARSNEERSRSRTSFDRVDSHQPSGPSNVMPVDTDQSKAMRDTAGGNTHPCETKASVTNANDQFVNPHEASSVSLEGYSQILSRNKQKLQQIGTVFDGNQDPFADSHSHSSRDFYDEPSKYSIPRPVPHQYPAVKGTMNQSSTSLPSQSNISTSQYQFQSNSQMQFNQQITPNIFTKPPTENPVHYSMSSQDKKDMLKRHLNAVVEQQSSSHISTHTTLHNPMIQSTPPPSFIPEPLTVVKYAKSEEDFMRLSEPLPWKDRPVEVVQAPLRSTAETANTTNYSSHQIIRHHQAHVFPFMNHDVAERLKETENWWDNDTRPGSRNPPEIANFLSNASAAHEENRRILALEAQAQRAANFPDDWSESSASTAVPEHPNARGIGYNLLVPVIANLSVYLDRKEDFGRFGKVPEWCIDKSMDGSLSFFGEDWGAPPPRVGRDPRYRPMLHEGRYTVFEDLSGRGGIGVSGRRAR
ncbi:hypothetical protein MMC14_000478 [Varicellaria rhodocarpa]|nr:hypothetical protein [Varicellaria rhodocarpa]